MEARFNVCHVEGSRKDLTELATALRNQRAISCTGTNENDLMPITRLRIQAKLSGNLEARASSELMVRANPNEREIVVSGNEGSLELLASNIHDLAEFGEHHHHRHIEWFEGNEYISEDSMSLIVSLNLNHE